MKMKWWRKGNTWLPPKTLQPVHTDYKDNSLDSRILGANSRLTREKWNLPPLLFIGGGKGKYELSRLISTVGSTQHQRSRSRDFALPESTSHPHTSNAPNELPYSAFSAYAVARYSNHVEMPVTRRSGYPVYWPYKTLHRVPLLGLGGHMTRDEHR